MSGSPDEYPFRDEAVPCGACGDKEGSSADGGGCRNHPEYAYCHDGTLFPLLRGKTFDPGYPARGPSYSSGGEPGEPARVLCPTCNDENGPETACTHDGCAIEPMSFEEVVATAAPGFQKDVRRAFLAFVTGASDARAFRRELIVYSRVAPQVILDAEGRAVFETEEAVVERKRRERALRRPIRTRRRRAVSWEDDRAAGTLMAHLAVLEEASA
jgi:hypothetical protein